MSTAIVSQGRVRAQHYVSWVRVSLDSGAGLALSHVAGYVLVNVRPVVTAQDAAFCLGGSWMTGGLIVVVGVEDSTHQGVWGDENGCAVCVGLIYQTILEVVVVVNQLLVLVLPEVLRDDLESEDADYRRGGDLGG